MAYRLAQATRSRLTLVHVIEPGVTAESATERLEALRDWLSSGTEKSDTRTVTLKGPVAAEIVNFASENEADLVVVGAPIPSLRILGPVVRQIGQESRCPVLVTPMFADFDGRFRRVIVCFGQSLFALPTAMLGLVRDCGTVEFLQVLPDSIGADSESNTSANFSEQTQHEVDRETKRLCEYTTAHVLTGAILVPQVAVEVLADVLLVRAAHSRSDLVVFGATHWRSVCDRLNGTPLDHIRGQTSLLVVPSTTLWETGQAASR